MNQSEPEASVPELERLLFTQSEAAAMFGISTKTLLKEVRDLRLRYVMLRGCRRFTRPDLDAYIEMLRAEWTNVRDTAKVASDGGRSRGTSGVAPRSEVLGFAEAVKRSTNPRLRRL